MSRRIWVNLAVFAMLFFVLLWWDLNNVLAIDAIKRPYSITAEFATSPGLRAGFGVSYLGVQVGKIGSVHLTGDHVTVKLKLNRGTKLPANLDASVRRKSAVGEPYVDLLPGGTLLYQQGKGPEPVVHQGGPYTKPGDLIRGPDKTGTPLEYSDVFDTIEGLVKAVPVESPDHLDVNTLLKEFATSVDGRTDDFRNIIVNADALTSTIGQNIPLFDQLTDELTTLTHTVTEHAGSLGTSFDNLGALTATLAQQKDHIASLLDHTPTLISDVQNLLNQSGPDIGCLFDEGAQLFGALDTPPILASFGQLVSIAPAALNVVVHVPYQGPDGTYLNGILVLTTEGANLRVYNPRLQIQPPPPIHYCQAAARNGTNGNAAGTAGPGTAPGAAGETNLTAPPAVIPKPKANHEKSSTKQTKGLDFHQYVWPVLIGLLVLAFLGLLTSRPWLWFAAKRQRQ